MSFPNYFGYIAPVICFGLTLWLGILVSYTNISEPSFVSPTNQTRNSRRYERSNYSAEESTQTCKCKKIIVFHKTHKCSSTTLQNILLRYAYNYNFNVVLPEKGNQLPADSGFKASAVHNTEWYRAGLQPQIFCLHNRWSYSQVAELMDHGPEKPVYFTIVRDPVSLFISVWDYYNLPNHIPNGRKLSLEEFALQDDKPNVISWGHMKFRDVTLFDFGLPVEDNDNMIAVQAKIKEISETFDLVMVMEHFDESMVLLKHFLCWEYSNLTSLKLNSHDESSKSHISDKARQKLTEWLNSDMVFYNHFKDIFKTKLEAFGAEKMSRELVKIQGLNQEAKERCPVKNVPISKLPKSERPWGSGVLGYKILSTDPQCKLMGMQEIAFIDLVRTNQNKRALISSNDKN